MPNIYKPLFLFNSLYEATNPVGIQSRRFVDALKKIEVVPEIFCKHTIFGASISEKENIHFIKEIPHKNISAVIRRLFSDLFLLPDIERYTYLPFLKKELNSVNNFNNYDWIHTISNPCSSHLAGLFLKRKTNLPWVAQFYDPWVGNSYRKFRTDFFKKQDEKIEFEIANNADIIIHTNDIIKNNWIQRYGDILSDKIFVLPFSYDENVEIELYNTEQSNLLEKRISVLYVGNLYLDRNLDDLIKAIIILKSKIPNLEKKIVFRFVGIVSNHDKENIKQNRLDNLFELFGQKSYNHLAEYYKNADVLLVIDAPAKENIFFPSKLIEYFMYKKPILGISPKISVTHNLLIESGNISIENGNIEEIVEYLVALLNNSKLLLNSDYYKRFSPNILANEYIEMIEQYLIKRSR